MTVDWDEATLGVSALGHTPLAYLDANDVANARLIAAAPEMAELLAEFEKQWDWEDKTGAPQHPDVQRARALLARIRGES